MKKIFILTIVMACLSFAFVACSGDDFTDDTDGTDIEQSDMYCDLSFNGKKIFDGVSLLVISGYDDDLMSRKNLNMMIYTPSLSSYFQFAFPLDEITLRRGMDIFKEEVLHFEFPGNFDLLDVTGALVTSNSSLSSGYIGYFLNSGSLIVEDYTDSYIEFRFENCKLLDEGNMVGIESDPVTINGTLKVPLDGEIHKIQ